MGHIINTIKSRGYSAADNDDDAQEQSYPHICGPLSIEKVC